MVAQWASQLYGTQGNPTSKSAYLKSVDSVAALGCESATVEVARDSRTFTKTIEIAYLQALGSPFVPLPGRSPVARLEPVIATRRSAACGFSSLQFGIGGSTRSPPRGHDALDQLAPFDMEGGAMT